MNNCTEKIKNYLNDNRNNVVDMLSDLVRIPSIATEGTDGAMFGENCKKAILHTEKLFRESGLETFTNKDAAYTLGKLAGDSHSIGIFCHADVVAVEEADWTVTKPFDPVERDGFLFGRGCDDNKSGIVTAIWALKALEYAGIKPKSTITVFAGSNEECGMSDLLVFNKEQSSPDISITPDNAYPVCRGEKGILRFWADFRKPFENIISLNGGTSLNVLLGKVSCTARYTPELMAELTSASYGKEEYTLSSRDGEIHLTANGISTHAAYPDGSLNALWVMIQALKQCKSLGGDLEILAKAEKLVADAYSQAVGLTTDDPEFLKTTCANGVVKTENGRLSLSFDTRYGTTVDVDAFIKGYTDLLDAMGADIRVTERDDGFIIDENAPIVKAIADTWNTLTGKNDKPYLSYGGTYARRLENAVSTGTSTDRGLPKLPLGHGGAHQSDECISIAGLIKSIEITAHIIIKADEILHA